MTTTIDRRVTALATTLSLLAFAAAPSAAAQDTGLASTVIAGYGTANYGGTLADSYAHDFSASISPILLFNVSDDVLFEAEFEFGLEGGETTTALEYAQIDYLGLERFQFSVGKFLLPFGIFGERLHPSWINRLPSMPLLYGHAHGGVAEGALLPILSDLGAMGRVNLGVGEGKTLGLSVYVTQGPRIVEEDELADDGHDHAEGEGHDDEGASSLFDIPTVAFGTNTTDNNQNKMLGARLGLVTFSGFEIYASGFHAMYDDGDFLDYTGGSLSVEWRTGPVDLRAEGVLLRQEFVADEATYETLERTGYYVEVAHRRGPYQPVVRWSQLLDGTVDGATARPGREELALGLNYWVAPSVPVKLAYSLDPDFDDRVLIQWAFGF